MLVSKRKLESHLTGFALAREASRPRCKELNRQGAENAKIKNEIRLGVLRPLAVVISSRVSHSHLMAVSAQLPTYDTRQTTLPPSSVTNSAPLRPTATPTGRPQTLPSGVTKPVMKSTYSPVARPSCIGT